jgi:hypothetical protein
VSALVSCSVSLDGGFHAKGGVAWSGVPKTDERDDLAGRIVQVDAVQPVVVTKHKLNAENRERRRIRALKSLSGGGT